MFTQEAPTSATRWPVVRILPGHSVEVQLLAGDWVKLTTHFNKVTFLCPEVAECDACSLLPSRPYWYLPCVHTSTRRVGILELSATASSHLEQGAKFAGWGVRAGVQIRLERKSAKKPLRVEVVGQAETPPVAKVHEWVSPLMALYKLPVLNVGESFSAYGDRVMPMVLQRANHQAAQMRASVSHRPKG